MNDLRYSIRALMKTPGFSLTVVLMLALGLGINTAIFSMLNSILLRPLPGIADPGTLVRISPDASLDALHAYRDQNRVFSSITGFTTAVLNLGVEGSTERVVAQYASASYFSTAGVQPALGRLFLPSDDDPNAEPAVVISHAYWKRRWAGAPSAVGSKVVINRNPVTIIGVAAEGFRGVYLPSAMEAWIPLEQSAKLSGNSGMNARLLARLKDGVTVAQAQANVAAIARELMEASGQREDRRSPMAIVSPYGPMPNNKAGPREFLAIMGAVTLLVLLVLCANVANLMLARGTARRRETAIRLAIGAGKARVIRPFLIEGLILSVAGAAGSVLIGSWSAEALTSLIPGDNGLPVSIDFTPDARVLLYVALLAVGSALAFGVLPALQSARVSLLPALRAGETAVMGRGSRLRAGLAIAQVALCTVLLAGSALLGRSVWLLDSVDVGINTQNILVAAMDPAAAGYKPDEARRFYSRALDHLSGASFVESATTASVTPFSGNSASIGSVYGGAIGVDDARFSGGNMVGPAYFRTLGIRILRGRDIAVTDSEAGPKVAAINESLARLLFPDRDPLGQQLLFSTAQPPRTIIAVVADIRFRRPSDPPPLMVYLPANQTDATSLVFHVRMRGTLTTAVAAVRRAAAEVDANLPVFDIHWLDWVRDQANFEKRLAGILVGTSGALGLFLASLGLYGVVALHISQRTREIGLRMALGASARSILGAALYGGAKLAVGGLLLGLGLALATTRVLATLLYGVTSNDPSSFCAAAVLLAVVTLTACWIPARRATRVDPVVALRND